MAEAPTSWFAEAGTPPEDAIAVEVARVAGLLDRPLRVTLVRG